MERTAVGYVRVSTARQASEGESLDAQRSRLLAWATANSYTMANHLFADEGISAASLTNRPAMRAAVAEACRLRCPLVAVSLSRLFRSVTDSITVGEQLAAHGADLVSLSEDLNTTTASGRLVFRLLALLGQFERELVSERTSSVLQHMASQGLRTGGLPYGFGLAEDGDHLTPDDREQSVIRDIAEWRAAGLSLRAISRRLEEAGVVAKGGGRKWRPGTVAAILRRAEATACGPGT